MWETPFLEYFLISVPQTLYHSVWRRTIKYSIYLYKSSFVTICQYEAFFANQTKYVILFQSQTKTMATYPLGRAVLERQKQGWVPPTSLILQISEARSYFYTQGPAKDQFRKELNRATRQRELQVSECVHIRDTKLDRSAEFPAINVQRCHQDTRSNMFFIDH